MNEEVRLVGNGEHEEDIWQYSLRPKLFNEYVGQEEAKGNLNVYIQAAKQRGEALDHGTGAVCEECISLPVEKERIRE